LKAAYTVPELAALVGISRWTLWRMLVRDDVATIRNGRGLLVPLVAFRQAYPPIWESAVVALGLHPLTQVECDVCRTVTTLGAMHVVQ
jgi:hypothetical protein